MATPTPLPDRPSMASMRKQAKALARAITAGEPAAVTRAQAHLPDLQSSASLRDAQLVLAREYGFTGWADLQREVLVRSGQGLEWAADQAEQAIHDDDVDGLGTVRFSVIQSSWVGRACVIAARPGGNRSIDALKCGNAVPDAVKWPGPT